MIGKYFFHILYDLSFHSVIYMGYHPTSEIWVEAQMESLASHAHVEWYVCNSAAKLGVYEINNNIREMFQLIK